MSPNMEYTVLDCRHPKLQGVLDEYAKAGWLLFKAEYLGQGDWTLIFQRVAS